MKSYSTKFKSLQWKIVQMGALQKLQDFIQNPYNFVACQCLLSILGDIILKSYHFPPQTTFNLGEDSQI